MKEKWNQYNWILATILGSAFFALGFDLFLEPYDMNAGGISGLALIIVRIFKFGSVGTLSVLINLPLFLLGGLKVGKRFFFGSLLGMAVSSFFLDTFVYIPVPPTEPLLAAVYGSVLCGFGLGLVFVAGTSTGGSDIVVRLLKLKYKNVPIGQISMVFDTTVAVLTGIAFQNVTNTLYTGIVVFLCSQVIDVVVYRFDYSKVALIITKHHEAVAKGIDEKLGRGSTFLYGQGSYSRKDTMVVLTAVKKQQLSDLKELVAGIDPDAFVIVQEAHQVLGDGFIRYDKNSL